MTMKAPISKIPNLLLGTLLIVLVTTWTAGLAHPGFFLWSNSSIPMYPNAQLISKTDGVIYPQVSQVEGQTIILRTDDDEAKG